MTEPQPINPAQLREMRRQTMTVSELEELRIRCSDHQAQLEILIPEYYSQKELAKEIGLSQSYLSYFLRGTVKKPSNGTLVLIDNFIDRLTLEVVNRELHRAEKELNIQPEQTDFFTRNKRVIIEWVFFLILNGLLFALIMLSLRN